MCIQIHGFNGVYGTSKIEITISKICIDEIFVHHFKIIMREEILLLYLILLRFNST